MRFLRIVGQTLSKGSWIRKRRFAQVHDVQIKVERRRPETTADNDTADTRESEEAGSMERNGTFFLLLSSDFLLVFLCGVRPCPLSLSPPGRFLCVRFMQEPVCGLLL